MIASTNIDFDDFHLIPRVGARGAEKNPTDQWSVLKWQRRTPPTRISATS
ncbi:hypothetical protein [Saccharopolyspora griseoalba]|uniref:Uncharacterized protein n=1 Tax=Saccharopolyspora griseoalba TaxID=1431848 RepID=A0ABW2LRB8_9PSEU